MKASSISRWSDVRAFGWVMGGQKSRARKRTGTALTVWALLLGWHWGISGSFLVLLLFLRPVSWCWLPFCAGAASLIVSMAEMPVLPRITCLPLSMRGSFRGDFVECTGYGVGCVYSWSAKWMRRLARVKVILSGKRCACDVSHAG